MKTIKYLHLTVIITAIIFLYSCNDDFLELKPLTKLAESEAFWENESSIETFSNSFYNYIDRGDILADFTSDNCEHKTSPPALRRGVYSMPTALGSGGWNWSQLRNINYFIQNVNNSKLDPSVKNKHIALGKFFRAWFYYKKVQQFGDVPWYSQPLATSDEDLIFKPRDPRTLIVDSIRKDIDFAIRYLPVEKTKNRISKWMGLALKSRILLYEGTYSKYHGLRDANACKVLLQEAVDASKELMESGMYTIYSTGDPHRDYFNLFQPKDAYTEEIILARSTQNQYFYYTPNFTSTSNGNYGATYSLISDYLMSNGETFQKRYPDESKRRALPYMDEFKDRDPRLWQTLVFPGYVRVGTSAEALTDFNQNTTGYMIHKRVGPPIEDQGGGLRDVIMIRYAEVLLNYAEAKAELGILTQEDLDISVNLIRKRVNLPPLSINSPLDPYLDDYYKNTSDPMILEIRRERRVELAFEGFRTEDLKRWKEGQLFRDRYQGMYIKEFNTYIDLNNDGSPDLYVLKNNQTPPSDRIAGVQYFRLADVAALSEGEYGRIIPYSRELPEFKDWEYLNPIPTEELTLNKMLKQNPGWDNLN